MSANLLTRIAEALERMAPAASPMPDWSQADAFVWHTEPDRLIPVAHVNRVPIGLLVGVDRARDILLENTRQFAQGRPLSSRPLMRRCLAHRRSS